MLDISLTNNYKKQIQSNELKTFPVFDQQCSELKTTLDSRHFKKTLKYESESR